MSQTALILTHHSLPNFGANLQALSTARALRARGVQARFVDFRPSELEHKYARSVPNEQRTAHASLIAEHLDLTAPVTDQSEFEALCRSAPADLYVTGSDAVFRLNPASTRADLAFPNPYWLVGVSGRDGRTPVKAALAPSAMGCRLSALPAAQQAGVLAALEDFALLSARDTWTAGQIAALGVARPVTVVPDPVFSLAPLLRAQIQDEQATHPYITICTQGRKDEAWVAALTRRAEGEGYETVALPTPEGRLDEGTSRQVALPLDPLDWARLLAGSAGYIGGRFHPVVVSFATGGAAVALDSYHRHPFERTRSKTWQLMHRFGLATACHSRVMHRVLTPGMVWAQLRIQMRNPAARLAQTEILAGEVGSWYDQIAAKIVEEAT